MVVFGHEEVAIRPPRDFAGVEYWMGIESDIVANILISQLLYLLTD
jgi:hypothetical protein